MGKIIITVLKDKCLQLLDELRLLLGNIEGRVFVDSAPILERAWAGKVWYWLDWKAWIIDK